MGQGLLIVKDSWSQTDTPRSVGLLWTSDWHITETSTWQHTTFTRDRHPCPAGIRTHNPRKRAAADPRLRLCGHRDRQNVRYVVTYNTHLVIRPLNKLLGATKKHPQTCHQMKAYLLQRELLHVSVAWCLNTGTNSIPPPYPKEKRIHPEIICAELRRHRKADHTQHLTVL